MNINIMSYAGLSTLKQNISGEIYLYNMDSPKPLLETLTGKPLIDTRLDCNQITLKISNSSDDDFENVKKMYSSLKNVLSDSKAYDERVWAGFAMKDHFWKYINTRWKKGGWKASTIKDRFFYGQHPQTRNALARLYWIGKMTYDPQNQNDPWHYTQFICTNQRFIEDILGRNMSDNLNLTKACIDACEHYSSENDGALPNSSQMRELQKYMSILGATYVLDSMDHEILTEKLYNKLCQIIAG